MFKSVGWWVGVLIGLVAALPVQSALPVVASSFRITVAATPEQVQVGHDVTVTVKASSAWGAKSSVTIQLSSVHHFINTAAKWNGHCTCFTLPIRLIPRVHPPEVALITATAIVSGATYTGTATTKIFGLYPNGKPEPIPAPKKPPKNSLRMISWVYPQPSISGQFSTLWIQTSAGSTCSAKVVYASGKVPSEFDGSPTETDGTGQANWTWLNAKEAATGTASVTCARDTLAGQRSVHFAVHT